MEKNNIIASDNHGISLQLRSKEVSEAMGKIPSWVGFWGTIIIFLLFIGSMLLIFNIHCVQKIRSTVTIMKEQVALNPETVSQDYFLQVTVPIEYNKIKPRQTVTLSFNEKNNCLNKLSGVRFLIDKITTNKNYCVVRLVGNSAVIEKTMLYNHVLLNNVAGCELVLDGTVFEKVFGSLF